MGTLFPGPANRSDWGEQERAGGRRRTGLSEEIPPMLEKTDVLAPTDRE